MGLPSKLIVKKLEFSQIQYGGGRRFEKPLNRDISATF